MTLSNFKPHAVYQELIDKVTWSHERGRSPAQIGDQDIALARLYSYAFRLHTIGAYHATRLVLLDRPPASALAMAHRGRAIEVLQDLADQGMEAVPSDFRAAISTLHRYHHGIHRVIAALQADESASGDREIGEIAGRFASVVGAIISCNGIHLTRDTGATPQASFVVPNLGITIVPLVYGDFHSWNLAFLNGRRSDVPCHRHHNGVEIHLGYGPMRGFTILGDNAAEVVEGYAMPIPPMTRHGYTNASDLPHNLPFIFGSLRQGGWGVFLDVEAMPTEVAQLKQVSRDSAPMRQTIYLEREIAAAARSAVARRHVLIPAAVTDRGETGGLELSISRANERGVTLAASDGFLAVSVVRGAGVVAMGGMECDVTAHDHFGIPAGMSATLRQKGAEPLVLLDSAIKRRFRG